MLMVSSSQLKLHEYNSFTSIIGFSSKKITQFFSTLLFLSLASIKMENLLNNIVTKHTIQL